MNCVIGNNRIQYTKALVQQQQEIEQGKQNTVMFAATCLIVVDAVPTLIYYGGYATNYYAATSSQVLTGDSNFVANGVSSEAVATASKATGTVWDVINPTADTIPGTAIPATFQLQTEEGTLWANANATEHMGEYISKFGDQSWTSGMRSQAELSSFNAAVNEAMAQWSKLPSGEYSGVVGGWELAINTTTGVIYHALYKGI